MGDIGDYWREAKEYKKKRSRSFITRCVHCKKEFTSNEALLEAGLSKFCSKECRLEAKKKVHDWGNNKAPLPIIGETYKRKSDTTLHIVKHIRSAYWGDCARVLFTKDGNQCELKNFWKKYELTTPTIKQTHPENNLK